MISSSAAALLTRRWHPRRRPRRPNDTGAVTGRSPSAPVATAPQRLAFDAPPGKLELRLTVEEAGGGGTLDSEIRDITVPDFTAPQVALSTPRVYRARTAREFQALVADAAAMPAAGPRVLTHRAAADSLRCLRSRL